jgi:hypothetical protein
VNSIERVFTLIQEQQGRSIGFLPRRRLAPAAMAILVGLCYCQELERTVRGHGSWASPFCTRRKSTRIAYCDMTSTVHSEVNTQIELSTVVYSVT